MRVLVVDDNPATRTVIRRILGRQFDLDVTECSDGMQALHAMSQERYGLVLLDVMMPTLDGFEVLQAMRESPSVGHVPVIMMTGLADEATVRRILDLGVTDFVVKPIRPAHLFERVNRVLAARRSATMPLDTPRPGFQPLVLGPSTPVIIADGSADFRFFFRKTVRDHCPVLEAPTALDALQACLAPAPPYALFVGSDLGLMSGDLLGRKIRTSHQSDAVRLIGIQPPQSVVRARKQSPYEAVIMRSFVPEVFLEGFTSLLQRQGRLSGLLSMLPDLKLLGIAAAEEALGTILQRPVALRPPTAKPNTSRSSAASIVLRVGPDQMPLCVQLSVPERTTKRLQERVAKCAVDSPAATADTLMPWLVTRISELLGRELQRRGLTVVWDEPEFLRAPARTAPTERGVPDELIALAFDVTGGGISLELHISAADSAIPSSSLVAQTRDAAIGR